MDGGHCFGISHFVMQLYTERLKAQAFGGSKPPGLQEPNKNAQREGLLLDGHAVHLAHGDAIYGQHPTPVDLGSDGTVDTTLSLVDDA